MYFKFYFISENWLKNSDFHKWFHLGRVTGTWQAIRKMSIRNKWNPVGLRKIFIWIFTCENADIPYNFLYGASLPFSSAVGTRWHGSRQKAFWFFFVPKTLCRCWRQQRSRRSIEDCLRKRACNKERQIFGASLSFFVL